ncbi:MAG: hypothetical protein RLZZ432_303, partial [Chloroflexota bacterium]
MGKAAGSVVIVSDSASDISP